MTATLKLRDENGNVYEIPALVGKKGDKGDTGEQGPKGDDGHTPVRGIDYWTTEDKTEIVADVLAAVDELILGGAS